MEWSAVAASAGAFGAFFSGLAIWISVRNTRALTGTSMEINQRQMSLTEEIHRQQILLSQRQLLLPLWEYLEKAKDIDPSKPVGPDMVKTVNTLELVALCWEGELIDADLIRRTFAEKYIYFYEKLNGCTSPPEKYKTGPEYLQENPAASRLYRELKREAEDRGKLRPLGKGGGQ